MPGKLISIIMPTYNREHTICRAIDSVLCQTYGEWELIIVDDASADSTKEVVDEYEDDRIIYYRNDGNKGPCASRNIGINLAKGDYITFLDSDCAYKEDKLEKQLEEVGKGYNAVYCPIEYYKGNECTIIPQKDEEYEGNDLLNALKVKNIVDTSAIFVERDFVKKIGMFDEEFPALEDYELAIRMAKNGVVGIVKELLVENFYSPVSITTDEKKKLKAFLLLFFKHNDLWDYSVLKQKYINILRGCISGYWGMNSIFIFEEFINSRLTVDFPDLARELNKMIVKIYHQEVTLFRKLKTENVTIIKSRMKDGFVIYGAGKRAKDIYEKLDDLEKNNIKYFVVTKKKEDVEGIGEREILSLREMCNRNENKNIFILLAMNRDNSVEAIQALEAIGYTNYLYCDNL